MFASTQYRKRIFIQKNIYSEYSFSFCSIFDLIISLLPSYIYWWLQSNRWQCESSSSCPRITNVQIFFLFCTCTCIFYMLQSINQSIDSIVNDASSWFIQIIIIIIQSSPQIIKKVSKLPLFAFFFCISLVQKKSFSLSFCCFYVSNSVVRLCSC